MSFADHFNGVIVVVEELVLAGATVRVWTDAAFRSRVLAAGAEFADLFAWGSLESTGDRSSLHGARGVTFAAVYGDRIVEAASAFGADLVIHDSFALTGRLVAEQIKLPRVIVTAGHAVNAAAFRQGLLGDPRVVIDQRCWEAVDVLRTRFEMADASPFSYVADPSPWLNICKEPAEWVNAAEHLFLDPIVHFGALPRDAIQRGTSTPREGPPRVYAAFGTVIWRYWQAEALQALEAIAEAADAIPGATLTIGLGGAQVGEDNLQRLREHRAVVHEHADQWAALNDADVFVTHHGLGSTHEAVACAVPMLSLPFFWDQPGLARRTQELGLALPLIDGVMPGNRLTPAAVRRGLEQIEANRDAMRDRLLVARRWEARTIEARPEIARQILAIVRDGQSGDLPAPQ